MWRLRLFPPVCAIEPTSGPSLRSRPPSSVPNDGSTQKKQKRYNGGTKSGLGQRSKVQSARLGCLAQGGGLWCLSGLLWTLLMTGEGPRGPLASSRSHPGVCAQRRVKQPSRGRGRVSSSGGRCESCALVCRQISRRRKATCACVTLEPVATEAPAWRMAETSGVPVCSR